MTENEKTRRVLVDQLANIIADYNARELSDTEWEGLNGEELECLLECLQFAQYKDVAIQALEEIQQYRAIGTVEEFKAFKLGRLGNKGFITIGQTIEEFKQEIRAKAIDEFAERIKGVGLENNFHCNDVSCEFCDGKCDECEIAFKKDIDQIVSQMKGNEFFNFDSPVARVDEKSYNKAISDFLEAIRKAYESMQSVSEVERATANTIAMGIAVQLKGGGNNAENN